MSDKTKKPRHRSPGYPSIDLGACIEKARVVWDKQMKIDAAAETICDYWGLSSKSGTGLTTMAAMKAFGLFEAVGSGRSKTFKLSDLAQRLVVEGNDQDRAAALREAAAAPKMHKEMADKFKDGLPGADEPIRYWLVRDWGFSEKAATDFIGQYRRTISLASEAPSGSIGGDEGGPKQDDPPPPPPPDPEARRHRHEGDLSTTLPLPLLSGTAELSLPGPLSEADFQWLKQMLDKLKGRIVADPDAEDGPGDEASEPSEPDAPPLRPGDLVQWESQGQFRFEKPRRITRVQEGFVFVEGSETGLPISEVLPAQ